MSPRRFIGADRVGGIVGLIGGAIGLCVGGAAAVTALIPSSALWMSGIVCSSGYQMAYNTSHYSYRPGQSGTNVSFQCVSDADSYDVNDFAVFALQSLLAAVVLVVAAAVGGLIWRARISPADRRRRCRRRGWGSGPSVLQCRYGLGNDELAPHGMKMTTDHRNV